MLKQHLIVLGCWYMLGSDHNFTKQLMQHSLELLKAKGKTNQQYNNQLKLEIAQWCKAIQKYATVFKQIEPKRKKMAQLQGELDKANNDLQEKMKSLNDAKEQVNKLKQQTEKMVRRKQELQKQLQLTKDRLVRAADLITLTKDEAVRWKQTVQNIKDFIVNIPLDVFIATASISYNGPFTGSFRKNLVDYWITIVNAKQLPMSEDYQITKTLADPLILRDWMINGLPSDSVSLENAIFAMQGHRWPLVIDPQYQAFKWLNNTLSQQKKCILKLTDNNFQSQMKASIKNGVPVLLVDVEDSLPAVLDSVFSKQIKTIDNMPMIKFGDQNIYYDSKFKIYIFTKVANPNFLPQIFIRVNIINFTVTFDGLKQQLLAMVVKHEKQEVQIQKDENVVKMGQYNKKINESQLNILRLLQKAKAQTILDDIQLIETLKVSQQAAQQIKIKIQESKEIQRNTTQIREQYKPVAVRGSVLFFVIKDLSLIDSMYQYSLQYIEKLFKISMATADNSNDLTTRLNSLIDRISKDIYKNIARGLFVKDKILFSFMIATSINREAKIIPDDLWNTFVRGPTFSDKIKKIPNPSKGLFSERGWQLAQYLENSFAKFTNLLSSFTSKSKIWQAFVQQNQLNTFPDGWEKKLDLFEKILVYRALKPERVVQSMTYYITNTIGSFYLETPNVTMKDIWSDSDNKTPIIFVLSPGADSTSALLKFANEMELELQIISLGQGQGIFAENLIKLGKQNGKWILLQNCHLAKTWMPRLEQIIQQNRSPAQQIHKQFRLFLTSMPASYFPASVLQNGIKLTTEPPRGIRANVKRSWNQIDQQQLNACTTGHQQTYHKMLWGLTFFHSVIQERQKFGPLGWNIKYQFNDSDLQTSKTVLTMLLNRPDNNIPFEALLFVTGQINYGGRVTDDWDRRCLMTILQKFYSQDVLTNKYCFSKAKQYYIPQFQSLENYKSHADSLPMQDLTLVFGMHQNANITYLLQEESKIMASLEMMQPKDVVAGGKSSQDLVLELVTQILQNKEVPQILDKNQANKELLVTNEKGLLPSLSIVLFQQITRFNQLLKVIKRSLEDLKKAIDGLILMSDQLDDMFYDLLANRVPNNWKKVAYPSLKPMNSWMKDLRQRVAFISNWLKDGIPTNYWLSSFFFPQGFLTAVLQQHARQPEKQIPIDQLIFTFRYTEFTKQSCSIRAAEGIYVSGLILQGASWDLKRRIMCDPIKGQMYNFMPIIQFIPTRIDEKKPNQKFQTYECPVYKTSVRAGVLSTTGQSTNFVLAVQMPSLQQSDYWVLQGTALLLQLNE